MPNAEDQRKPSGLRHRRARLRDPVGHHSVPTVGSTDAPNTETALIAERFDSRTLANMEVALDRVCERFPKQLATHEARKHIAACILERASGGERTLKGLTEAAIMGATVVSSRKSEVNIPLKAAPEKFIFRVPEQRNTFR